MSQNGSSLGDRLASGARLVLITAITVIAVLIVVGPNNHTANPLKVGPAQADGSVAAAPGYLMMTVKQGGAAKFYLCDTNKQMICVYETNGEKLRLVGARKFDHDSTIFDASLNFGKARSFEGGNGIDRKTAEIYATEIKEAREKAAKKK